MKKQSGFLAILIISITAFGLCACSDPGIAKKSTFGEVDPMQEGQVLIGAKDGSGDGADEEQETEEAVTGNKTMKTSKTLDLTSLPAEVSDMVGLCDAINMTCVEQQKAYDQDSAEFVWHCVHMYVCNCNDKRMGIDRVADYCEVAPAIVDEVIYAMFGKLRDIPQIPGETFADEGGAAPHVMISNDLMYRFHVGDRGMSEPELRRATQYSDGSMEMEVALVDSDTQEETVSFIYTMRSNTRDTTTSALFHYEITGVRPADKLTTDKMEGMPFLVELMRVYGGDAEDGDEAKRNEIDEVLYFGSFADDVPGINDLNARISDEILEYADMPVQEGSWHELISYPLTSYEYIQFACTFATYPNNGDDPDIRCYNYDKGKSRAADANEIFLLCGKSAAQLSDAVKRLYRPREDGETLKDFLYKGFMVRRDNSFDVFYMLTVSDAEGAEHKRLYVYNSGSDSLRYAFDDGGVIPEEELDVMKPPLTHGRKDQ